MRIARCENGPGPGARRPPGRSTQNVNEREAQARGGGSSGVEQNEAGYPVGSAFARFRNAGSRGPSIWGKTNRTSKLELPSPSVPVGQRSPGPLAGE